MQMIAWAWQGERRKQGHWAGKLGTTTDGSAISDMVRVVNNSTGFDREDRAGPYIVLDISSWSYKKWLLLNMRHLVDYRAPLVLHPVLLKRYYPYLDDDASGHFQVGRGYDKRGKQADPDRLLRAVEPAALRPLRALHLPGPVAQRLQELPRQPGPLPAEHRRLMRRAHARPPGPAPRRHAGRLRGRRAPPRRRPDHRQSAVRRPPSRARPPSDRRPRRRRARGAGATRPRAPVGSTPGRRCWTGRRWPARPTPPSP